MKAFQITLAGGFAGILALGYAVPRWLAPEPSALVAAEPAARAPAGSSTASAARTDAVAPEPELRLAAPPAAGPTDPAGVQPRRRYPDDIEQRIARGEVDRAYLDDLFDGKIRGVPDEKQAGLSIAELHRLGRIPYVERLEQEGPEAREELRQLGIEPSTGWPNCVRRGDCTEADRRAAGVL